MREVIKTRILKLRHDAATSERIGQLATQQNMAYNRGVDILQKSPAIGLWPKKDHPESFKGSVSQWIRIDGRVNGPKHLLNAGAQQAWDAHEQLKHQRTLRSLDENHQTGDTEPHDMSPLKLNHRSRKHDRFVLTCLEPPLRSDPDRFGIPGASDLVLHTKEEVPELDIRSFRLVEIRSERHGANRPLRKRRYALHLHVVETYPEPATFDSVGALNDVLGIKDAGNDLLLSDGDVIPFGNSKGIQTEQKMRSTAARKKKGSKRQRKLLRQVHKKRRRRQAEHTRAVTEDAKSILEKKRPKVVALSPQGCQATAPLVRHVNSLTRRHGPSIRYVLTAAERAMITEAERQGIATFTLLPGTLLPRPSEENDNTSSHRDGHDTQAVSRCRRREPNASQDTARDLQMRAFQHIGPAANRTLLTEETPMGRRVKPSRDARDLSCELGADKLPGDSGQIESGHKLSPPNDLPGVSLKAGSSSGQGAQRQLISPVSTQYIITDELFSIINIIRGENLEEKTKSVHAEAMAVWTTWATVNRCRVLPAEPASIAVFMARQAEIGRSTGTIKGYLRGIRKYHELLGMDSPVTNEVTETLKGIESLHGCSGEQALGLSLEDVKTIDQTVFTPLQRETPERTRVRGLKVIALIKLMWYCGLRRSEAAAATWGDINRNDDGSGILDIKISKTDRIGQGATQYFPQGTMDVLSAIRNGSPDSGSIFGWNERQISYRIEQTMRLAGLNGRYSTHSMRRGMAQELVSANVTMDELREAGRWDDDAIAIRYGLPDDPKKGAVAQFYASMAEKDNRAHE